jgi:ferric-dicitrate binding protein FerR (iron transport regulator)
MTNREDRYAWAAARVLRDNWPAGSGGERRPQRDPIVAAMELEMAKIRRRRRASVGAALAMAAAVAAVVGLRFASPGIESRVAVEHVVGQGNLLVRGATVQALSASVAAVEGDEIRSDEHGGATLSFRNGTHLALSRASRLRVDVVGRLRRFSLIEGQVDAEVTKLAPQERFVVGTPDAEVEVRGTRFSVAVSDAPAHCAGTGTRSLVAVREGAVWVRTGGREIVLGPGQSWTAACDEIAAGPGGEAPTVAAPAAAVVPPVAPARPASRHPAASLAPARLAPAKLAPDRRAAPPDVTGAPRMPPASSAASDSPASSLAEQNDLLSAAMAAERAGEHQIALRKLDQLLARFPTGPLFETARAERQRIQTAETRSSKPNGQNGK